MAAQILEWISISKLMVETVWSVGSAAALITVQWLYAESLTQFRFLIKKTAMLSEKITFKLGEEGSAHRKQANDIAQIHGRGHSPEPFGKQ